MQRSKQQPKQWLKQQPKQQPKQKPKQQTDIVLLCLFEKVEIGDNDNNDNNGNNDNIQWIERQRVVAKATRRLKS